MNPDYFEEHKLFEIKIRLEEEILRNEVLDRKVRDLEFKIIKGESETINKMQEVDMKQSILMKRITDL